MTGTSLDGLLGRRGRGVVVSWLLVGFVLAVAASSLALGDVLWAGFAGVVAALALVPPAVERTPHAMLPWELLALAALPLLGRTVVPLPVADDLAGYLSVAALALVVAVELDAFTPVEMSHSFAVFFVVVATLATAGVWAVARWSLDVLVGTAFLLDPALTEDAVERALMWEFVYSTVAGVLAGVAFELYFRRRRRLDERLPGPTT